jgi:hypothetical protein
MKKHLVFIHGRSQEFKDAGALKGEWVGALVNTLDSLGLKAPISEEDIRFPYYGQTLYDLVDGAQGADVSDVILQGVETDTGERDFLIGVAREMQQVLQIKDEEVQEMVGGDVIEQGAQDWKWVRGLLRLIDSRVGGASGASIAAVTKDVYQYLRNPGIRDAIEAGVLKAFEPGVPTVVLGHSLGSVVAYNVLKREGVARGWKVPLFITVGSPLAVTMIRKSLRPIGRPQCVEQWFNARDPRDVVALYPLDNDHFAVSPAIENKNDVVNKTPNRHGIAGYLSDPVVVRKIFEALH